MSSDLHYIYVKDGASDVVWRYLGVFSSRAVADEWWRAVSTCSSPAIRESIRRITPQFYTHNSARALVPTTLTDPNVTPQFLDRVFFTLLNDRDGRIISAIPPDHSRDLISGQTFYIRSTTNHNEYWFCDRDTDQSLKPFGPTVVSSHPSQRTLFRISRTAQNSNGTVMIGSDEITVVDAVSGVLLSTSAGDGTVIAGGAPGDHTFKLGDLLGFRLRGDRFSNRIVLTDDAQGETWELA